MQHQTWTDCGSYEGETVGLIDSIITCAHVLRGRNLAGQAVDEALRDLQADPAVRWLMGAHATVRKPTEELCPT